MVAVNLAGDQCQPTFDSLSADVLEKGTCIDCGLCLAVCQLTAAGVIGRDEGTYNASTTEHCGHCGLCFASCPVSSLGEPAGATPVEWLGRRSLKTTLADVQEKCQDGGAATTLLITLIEQGLVDATIVVNNAGKAIITNSRDEIVAAAGSKYDATCLFESLLALKDMTTQDLQSYDIRRAEELRLAITALPCQLHGLKKMQQLTLFPATLIKFKIALICQEEGRNCASCSDRIGTSSDVACGAIGSDEGATTALIRSIKGQDAITRAIVAGALQETAFKDFEAINGLISGT